ncbi:MAG: DUF5103 domain-containing protein [Muribaculaceae bacterium]|nr:DUF5103 domain-containing protein [Muribaculaceae bacterium]
MVTLLRFITLAAMCLRWSIAMAETTEQAIFNPAFKTLEVYVAGNRYAPPVINMADPADRLIIEFDELSDDRRYMRYALTHCDARWRPEGLVESEFLDGFNEGVVEQYDYSRATTVHYIHYIIELPNEQMRITQPGNYLLRVYDESDPDNTILQVRFGVMDPAVGVSLQATTRTDIDTNMSHQQLGVRIDTSRLRPADPFTELRVVITQNGRPDNEVMLVTPQRLGHDEVIYEHLQPLIFDAGNEYRRFETVTLYYPGMGVEWIDRDAPVTNMGLYPDTPRTMYLYDQTQHGRFLIRDATVADSSTEADYVLTHFALEMPQRTDGDIFIEGDLTNRRFDPSSRMVYNHATGRYERSLLLKQGSYNYQYLFVPSGSMRGQTGIVEGDNYQTVNEYTVRVYHRPYGTRFDRLVGVSTISTGI